MKTKKSAAENTIKLMACAVNNSAQPFSCAEELRQIDYKALYEFCSLHSIVGIVDAGIDRMIGYYGLDPVCLDGYNLLHKSRQINIYKETQFMAERKSIFHSMADAGIWYMSLKGIVMKDIYPQKGMREMCDNDILFDSEFQSELRAIMEEHGYTCTSYAEHHHDTYKKGPFLYFEMHTSLAYDELGSEKYSEYDRNPRGLMIKDESNACGYHMSVDDFYIYMIAHAFKHYNAAGTGLRMLADVYLYINRYDSVMDWAYVKNECREIGMESFEETMRSLTDKLLTNGIIADLSEAESNMLDFLIESYTYGTEENKRKLDLMKIEKNTVFFDGSFNLNEAVSGSTMLKYLWRRVFPKQEELVRQYPLAKKRWAVPLVRIYRLAVKGIRNRAKLVYEVKTIMNR